MAVLEAGGPRLASLPVTYNMPANVSSPSGFKMYQQPEGQRVDSYEKTVSGFAERSQTLRLTLTGKNGTRRSVHGSGVSVKSSAASIPPGPWMMAAIPHPGEWPSNVHTQPWPNGVWASCGHRLYCTLCTLASHGSRTLTRRSNPSNFAPTARDTKRGLSFLRFSPLLLTSFHN